MADTNKDARAPPAKTVGSAAESAAKAAKPQGNPVFRMMGRFIQNLAVHVAS